MNSNCHLSDVSDSESFEKSQSRNTSEGRHRHSRTKSHRRHERIMKEQYDHHSSKYDRHKSDENYRRDFVHHDVIIDRRISRNNRKNSVSSNSNDSDEQSYNLNRETNICDDSKDLEQGNLHSRGHKKRHKHKHKSHDDRSSRKKRKRSSRSRELHGSESDENSKHRRRKDRSEQHTSLANGSSQEFNEPSRSKWEDAAQEVVRVKNEPSSDCEMQSDSGRRRPEHSRQDRTSREGSKGRTTREEESRSRVTREESRSGTTREESGGRTTLEESRSRSAMEESRSRTTREESRSRTTREEPSCRPTKEKLRGRNDRGTDGHFAESNDDREIWGKPEPKPEKEREEKAKPNLGLSGKLTEDVNMYKGVVIKYSQPPEARKPKRRWRWYIFKGNEELPFLPLHRQSAYLIGRERRVVDVPTDHPSCSKQHAVLQYRLVRYTREDGTTGRTVKPYIIDLESANGTYVNNRRITPRSYVELFEKDVVKFGYSSREYVLLHETSRDSDAEIDVADAEPEMSPVSALMSLSQR